MIFLEKKLITCCKCNKKYSFDKNLFEHLGEYILICPNCNLMHKVGIKLIEQKYGNLKRADNLKLTAIDVGPAAAVRSFTIDYNNTLANARNPANDTGILTSIEVYTQTKLTDNVIIATFYVVSGTNLTSRDSVNIGEVPSGSKQTFTEDKDGNPIALLVNAGDMIGIYSGDTAGVLYRDTAGLAGLYRMAGDYSDCTNQTFALWANQGVSVYGAGETAAAGKKWNGATITKFNGVTISKLNGA